MENIDISKGRCERESSLKKKLRKSRAQAILNFRGERILYSTGLMGEAGGGGGVGGGGGGGGLLVGGVWVRGGGGGGGGGGWEGQS